MPEPLAVFLLALLGSATGVLALSLVLTAVPRFGAFGRRVSETLARAPMLDLVLIALIFGPWLIAAPLVGWAGFAGAIAGQIVGLQLWIYTHELMHMQHVRGPRIVWFINRRFGRLRNHFALWVTVIALPVFWLVRLAQVAAYPWLVWVLGFPKYSHAEWVNVSRHKFEGLVGHDLIWCLYCDWMTGVYSLGGEMLRNVESFWCPIRFYDGKKCENCRIDFPDIDGGWAPADGTMADVVDILETKYPPEQKTAAWFGHPIRLTHEGQPVPPEGERPSRN